MIDRMDDNFDELLHPANAFEHPSEVVNDPDLTLNEKRAILASWASDACAIEAAPELRARPQGSAVRFEEIMEALRALDKQANGDKSSTASPSYISTVQPIRREQHRDPTAVVSIVLRVCRAY